MHVQDSSSGQEDQFSVDSAAFVSETIPNTGIRLLRPKPETEAALAQQLDIPRRLELLRRQGPTHPTAPRLLQDEAEVGTTSTGKAVRLILSVVAEPQQWSGGWFLSVVPPAEIGAWQVYLVDARKAIVAELRSSEYSHDS